MGLNKWYDGFTIRKHGFVPWPKYIGVTSKTAWALIYRIRSVMGERYDKFIE